MHTMYNISLVVNFKSHPDFSKKLAICHFGNTLKAEAYFIRKFELVIKAQ